MSIREAVSRISTYSADTFGVCSALFELGGMIVIHDPSGCNSTYTTHDEPRWYDQDSLIFISGLTEMDALMGHDEKLIHDVIEEARQSAPAFIVLLCTPVPLMMGTDLAAIAAEIEEATGIPTVAGTTNSMETYEKGISWALEWLAKEMVQEKRQASASMCCSWQPTFASANTKAVRANVLGMTPLDFAYHGSERTIRRLFMKHGITVTSLWAMGSRLEEIRMAAEADVNVVVSYGGLAAAKELQRRFGQPYVIGVPMGGFQETLWKAIKQAVATGESQYPCMERCKEDEDSTIVIIGESVYAASLARAIELEIAQPVRVYCPVEAAENTMLEGDWSISSEGDLKKRLQHKAIIIADPLYEPICPKEGRFIPLGHVAFSGRLYQEHIPELMKSDEFAAFIAQVKGE